MPAQAPPLRLEEVKRHHILVFNIAENQLFVRVAPPLSQTRFVGCKAVADVLHEDRAKYLLLGLSNVHIGRELLSGDPEVFLDALVHVESVKD
jgi:hypothetical protein